MRAQSISLLLVAFLLHVFSPPAAAARCRNPEQTELIYRGDGTELQAVYDQLKTCPNITSLELDMTSTGCVVYPEPWHFDIRDGDRLPALKKLSLSRYDLEGKDTGYIMPEWSWTYWAKQKAVNSLRVSRLAPGIVEAWDESNLEKWLRVMDFSQMEALSLAQSDPTFYDRMKDELPSLRSLSLFWTASPNATAPANSIDFLSSVPPLQDLSITVGAPYIYAEPEYGWSQHEEEQRMAFPLTEVLDRHCPSLRSLTLKQHEGIIATKRRPMLSLENITSIHESCPNLESLELDIDRDAETGWPLQTLDALTNIESLASLTLRLELGADLHRDEHSVYETLDWNSEGLERGGPFREPTMNRTAAEALFAYLRGNKKGKALDRVVFEVGDYTEKPYMGALAFPDWDDGRARIFECHAPMGNETREGEGKFGWCNIVGNEDPFPYRDDVVAAPVMEMWGAAEEAAVADYLARLTTSE